MTRFHRIALSTAVVLATSASAISAQVTVGSGAAGANSTVGPFGLDAVFGPNILSIAQTFVTPTGNNRLQSFAFYLNDFSGGTGLRLVASVYAFSTDRIVGPALFTSGIVPGSDDQSGTPDPRVFTVSPNLTLNAGSSYAFVLRTTSASPDGSTNLVFTTLNNSYSGGQLLASLGATDAQLAASGAFGTFGGSIDSDAAFSASFAPGTIVPEPSSVVLLAAGLIGIVVVNRRRIAR